MDSSRGILDDDDGGVNQRIMKDTHVKSSARSLKGGDIANKDLSDRRMSIAQQIDRQEEEGLKSRRVSTNNCGQCASLCCRMFNYNAEDLHGQEREGSPSAMSYLCAYLKYLIYLILFIWVMAGIVDPQFRRLGTLKSERTERNLVP